MTQEAEFLNKLSIAVGVEDYDRDSIKSRFNQFREYMRTRFSFDCPIIIVGGTNGKGEVAKTLARLAHHNDIKAAVWTSPHIESVVERYEFNNQNIVFEELAQRVTMELESSTIKLSYFEVLFTTFCQWATEIKPELLIMEVGLGGRLDATNVFDADVSIITSISRDHIKFLGGSYGSILNEKFEIARRDGFFIGQSSLEYIRNLMKSKAQKLGCKFEVLKQDDGESFSKINRRISELAFQSIYPKASMDIIDKARVESYGDFIQFNGAHNLDGMRQLMHSLCRNKNENKTELLLAFSFRSTAEVVTLLKTAYSYKRLFNKITVTAFDHTRALDADASRQLANECGIFFEKDWKRKINESIRQESPVLVAGSYYFIGEVKHYLNHDSKDFISTKTPV